MDGIPDSAALVPATRATSTAATSHRRIDVVEVHDFSAPTDGISYEGRGFAEQWGGCKIVEAEDTSIGWDLRVDMIGRLTALGVIRGG